LTENSRILLAFVLNHLMRQLARRFANNARTAGTSLTGIFIAVDVVDLYAASSSARASASDWRS
jgi:hypothetical protein